jgi:hypothetical protein
LYADNLQRNVRYRLNFYLHDKQLVYVHPSLYDGDRLTLASLLIAIEEVIRLLLTGPLQVQWEDDERWEESGPDKSAVINAESLEV